MHTTFDFMLLKQQTVNGLQFTFQQLTMITKKLITAKQPYYRCSICKSGENNSKKRKPSTCHMPRGPPLNGVNKLQMHNQYKKNMFVISYHRQT